MQFFEKNKNDITIKKLKEIKEFKEFATVSTTKQNKNDEIQISNINEDEEKTPLEILEDSYIHIQKQLAYELLEKVKLNTWQFFEDLVIELMVKMGYGGSKNLVRKNIQRTNDEGIDGVINEDKLGLDTIYLQAKRWTKDNSIGRPEIQKFVGALQGKRAKKGVFITTGSFSNNAYDYVKAIDPKVILIDGELLSNLMIEYNVGTTTVESYHIKKIDLDYFEV